MSNSTDKKVFFHVGLGKTGSTYLQKKIFPKFGNIHYIHSSRYKSAKKIVENSSEKKLLFSREFDRQFEAEVSKFSKFCPDAYPIIVFRRHDGWIASQYRRFVKNGNKYSSFSEFLDLEADTGFFKKKHLEYVSMVRFLESHFSQKPLILIYEDLRKNPEGFFKQLAAYMDCTFNYATLSLSSKHSSYSQKQLKGMLAAGKYVNLKKRTFSRIKLIQMFAKLPVNGLRYLVLFISGLLPDSVFSKDPILDPKALKNVEEYFSNDWKEVNQLARSQQYSIQ